MQSLYHYLFPFQQQLFEEVSLRRTQFAFCGANIIEHNSPFYFQLPVIKRLLLWSSYNPPAHHKLNLPCFLWLTIEPKFDRPRTKAFHLLCHTIYKSYRSHDQQLLWVTKPDQCYLRWWGEEVKFYSCLEATIALIRHIKPGKQFPFHLDPERQISSISALVKKQKNKKNNHHKRFRPHWGTLPCGHAWSDKEIPTVVTADRSFLSLC